MSAPEAPAAESSDETARPRRRGRGRPFKPGESGNPGGRPRALGEVPDLCCEQTPAMIGLLVNSRTLLKALAALPFAALLRRPAAGPVRESARGLLAQLEGAHCFRRGRAELPSSFTERSTQAGEALESATRTW